jgi:hypothetical protein
LGITKSFSVSFSISWGFFGSFSITWLSFLLLWFFSISISNLLLSVIVNFNGFLSGGSNSKNMVSHFFIIGKWWWASGFIFRFFRAVESFFWGLNSGRGVSGINFLSSGGGSFIRLSFLGFEGLINDSFSWISWISWGLSWFSGFFSGDLISAWSFLISCWGGSWLFIDSNSRCKSEKGNNCE